jgi:hypothetical protein
MKSWIGAKHLIFLWRLQCAYTFSRSTKDVFACMERGTLHYGSLSGFRIVTESSQTRGFTLSGTMGHAEHLCEFDHWEYGGQMKGIWWPNEGNMVAK